MQALPPIASMAPSAESQYGNDDGLNGTKLDDFLKLMIAELQNQDPLDPMKNSEMLQQLGQIREIGATDNLTTTLQSVLMGQNLTTASSLIGKDVNALSDEHGNISGTVDRVSVEAAEDGDTSNVRIHIGEYSVALKNIREILPNA